MIYILEHSFLEHYLTIIRKQPTYSHFKYSWSKISNIVATLVTKDFNLVDTFDESGEFAGYKFQDNYTIISIFPNGIQLAKAFTENIPNSKSGYLGYSFGIETNDNIEETLCLLPEDISTTKVILCDAIVKTGNTVKNALSRLQIENVPEISVVSVFSTTDGVENIRAEFPQVPIYVCALETMEEIEKISFVDIYLRYYNL
ncbi:MAG: hypothetical protein N2560_00210 [Ignavibacteria bacterium]|nr:hypothetical protein [Ignavibacteria bacterium]